MALESTVLEIVTLIFLISVHTSAGLLTFCVHIPRKILHCSGKERKVKVKGLVKMYISNYHNEIVKHSFANKIAVPDFKRLTPSKSP